MLGLAWKSLGWFLASVAVALGFLLVPLQVAAERKKLDRTVGDIARAERDIRALETEFDTRANLAQLDKWNAEKLGLVAPSAGQFVADEAALAAIEPSAPNAPQLASFKPLAPLPEATATTSGAAAPVQAAAVQTAALSTPRAQPAVATVATAPHAKSTPVRAAAPVARTAMAAVAAPKPRAAVAMLDRALLDDSMLGDLRSGARAETRSRR
ncbi:hypothetical protein [Sphingomonas sp. TREG-RG-20F-R18-01]|uniref:hypothetical protein n=1 Tax=Sphingomonas sp. TREG-RG-20F-R18-01 TaxID=2914982 RepID=UPI001F56B8FE|nr:hypothetical protein [Sphingomonas sp. TREG-RG-20F-R18-01]